MGKSRKSKGKSTKYHFSKIGIIVFLVVCALSITIGFAFKSPIEKLLNASNTSVGQTTQTIDYDGLMVHFVDVGQGDCIAIRFPDNKTMLIDAGPASSKTQMIDYLNNNFFKDKPKTFDYLLLTHSDEDHCGGMLAICESYQVSKIYRPMVFYNYNGQKEETDKSSPKYCTTKVYYDTIMAFKNETENIVLTDVTTCNGAEKIDGGNYYFDFYSPKKTTTSVKMNDFSPIMVLNYNGKKLMFTGDATTSGEENDVLDTVPKVDLLKVGHHGSRYSSSEEFLAKTKPSVAVIQCGEGNKYNHPHSETVIRLNYISADIYRTDQNGNIIVNVSTDAQLNIYLDKINDNYVIKVEYIIGGIILLSASLCFGVRLKIKDKR